MTLFRLEEFNPYYREELFDGEDFKGIAIFAEESSAKIGRICDALVDYAGYPQYFVIEIGFWVFRQKRLLPIEFCVVDEVAERVYAIGLSSKHQVKNLLEYDEKFTIDDKYEDQVKRVYCMVADYSPLYLEPAMTLDELHQIEAAKVEQLLDLDPNSDYDSTSIKNQNEIFNPQVIADQNLSQTKEVSQLYQESLISSQDLQVDISVDDSAISNERQSPISDNTVKEPVYQQVTQILNELEGSRFANLDIWQDLSRPGEKIEHIDSSDAAQHKRANQKLSLL